MALDEKLAEASKRLEDPEPQIAAAVAEFCKNPYWREYYEKATGHAREYIELEFWHSSMRSGDPSESQCLSRIDFIEGKMTSSEWKYVYDHAKAGGAIGMALAKYRKKYEKALAREEDWKRPECVEVSEAWERFLKKEISKEDYLKVSDAVYKRAASKAKSGEWNDQAFDNFCALADDHLNRLKGEEGWL